MERERINFKQNRVEIKKERPSFLCPQCQKKEDMIWLETSLSMQSFHLVFANHVKDGYFFCTNCHAVFTIDDGPFCDRFSEKPKELERQAEEKLRFLYFLP